MAKRKPPMSKARASKIMKAAWKRKRAKGGKIGPHIKWAHKNA